MEDEKKDEEQIVEDTDADTADVIDEEKNDEEQVVEDADADTSDIDEKLDGVLASIDALSSKIEQAFDKFSNVLLRSSANASTPPADEDIVMDDDEDEDDDLIVAW